MNAIGRLRSLSNSSFAIPPYSFAVFHLASAKGVRTEEIVCSGRRRIIAGFSLLFSALVFGGGSAISCSLQQLRETSFLLFLSAFYHDRALAYRNQVNLIVLTLCRLYLHFGNMS